MLHSGRRDASRLYVKKRLIEPKVPFFKSFYRSQAASFVATISDFSVMLFLTEIVGFWYVISVTLGGITGGVISFFLSRNWAFEKKDMGMSGQAFRYIFTSGSSLLLNIGGVYILTEYFGSHYAISKIIISVVVGILFNFLMFRYFVFR